LIVDRGSRDITATPAEICQFAAMDNILLTSRSALAAGKVDDTHGSDGGRGMIRALGLAIALILVGFSASHAFAADKAVPAAARKAAKVRPGCPDGYGCYPLYGAYGPWGGAAYWSSFSPAPVPAYPNVISSRY
jgi:hypothetical protein